MTSVVDSIKPSAFWDGETKGEEIKIDGVEAYISKPSSPTTKAILFINDIFGWQLHNTRLLADRFAAAGFLSLVPDYFYKDPVPLKEMMAGNRQPFLAWRDRNGPEIVLPLIDKFLDYLHKQDIKSIGALGICWGGRFGVLLAATDKVQALVVNHGGCITEDMVKEIKQPTMFNGSDNDEQIPRDLLNKFEQILASKEGLPSDVKFFDGANHGWTTRGDASDPVLAPKIVDAFKRGESWFQKNL